MAQTMEHRPEPFFFFLHSLRLLPVQAQARARSLLFRQDPNATC